MEVTEVLLPGVGVRYEFKAASGDDVGILARRDGERDMVRIRRSDPYAAVTLFTVDKELASALADTWALRTSWNASLTAAGRSRGSPRRPSTSRRAPGP